jgi:hypothetical protein
MRRIVPPLALAVGASGCGLVGGGGLPPVVADLEVFNRTVEDLLYVAADGESLEVPACGSASDPTFRVDTVSVRAAGGYVRAFGGDFSHVGDRRLVVVEVARAADSGFPEPVPPPDPLPPCEGHPEAQPGS